MTMAVYSSVKHDRVDEGRVVEERLVVGAPDVVVRPDQGIVGERDERAEPQRVEDEDGDKGQGRRHEGVTDASLAARTRRANGADAAV